MADPDQQPRDAAAAAAAATHAGGAAPAPPTTARLPPAPTRPGPGPGPRRTTPCEFSLRRAEWAYIRLQHLRSRAPAAAAAAAAALDAVTAHLHIAAALRAFLGLHGAAVAVDILALRGPEVWIRVPAGDRAAVVAAVGGWTHGGGREGWRVRGWGHWSAAACGHDGGRDLFV